MNEILVVDDDPSILQVIKMRMELEDFQITTAPDCRQAINKVKAEVFDLALVDLNLKHKSGLDLMEDLHKIDPELPVIILTGYGTIKSAVESMKKGAYSYLTKPIDFSEAFRQIRNCLEKSQPTREVKRLRKIVKEKYSCDNIIGKSEKIKKVMTQVAQAAETDSIVYINGESGTGKELIAKCLHTAGARKEGPFVAINCAAIPEALLESELFGYEKGAFTGADRRKRGLFSQANGGTFFLDEISEMSVSMQAKLLRVLEDKKVFPLGGGEKPQTFDARILVASNRKLEEEVKKGKFREDLFYRIHVIPIYLPPLRERKEDITLLAYHFLSHFSKQTKKKINGFSSGALEKLLQYRWPGNIRELKNAVEAAVLMSDRDHITEDIILPMQQSEKGGLVYLKDAKENFEKDYLIQLMEVSHGNVTQAAKLAGKYRADLYEMLKKHSMKPADYRR
jgi:two-component system response regulator GlrR